ncbi:MAG: NAD(P)-dependent oxidoreductase [Methanomicrobiales archaeon]|jgi:nucleoside-diphosphate-sugar epimerase|nr:NAD(P)-dependent oxidoreductase [Methanomicrobiales archaeon]
MNILITGSTGLLGRELTDELSKNHTVYALVRNEEKSVIWNDKKNVIPIVYDLSANDGNGLPDQIDVIYYLAQSRQFRDFPGGTMDTIIINTVAPVFLAHWGLSHGVKSFYYASTGSVYSPSPEPLHELSNISITNPHGMYPDSKIAAEILLRNFQSLFTSFAIIRPFFIYGPLQEQGMLIPRLIKNIDIGEKVTISGDDGFKFNPIYVSDAAHACVQLLKIKTNNIINIAGSEIITFGELIRTISKKINKKPTIERDPNPVNDLIADNQFMIENLAKPVVTLDEGLTTTIKQVLGR